MRHPDHVDCPVHAALDIIGGKWKPVILAHLMDDTLRFNELRRLMPKITQRMLTLQLRELEADAIVSREVYRQVPPKVEYSLTEHGQTLAPVLLALRDWGTSHALPHAKRAPSAEPNDASRRRQTTEPDEPVLPPQQDPDPAPKNPASSSEKKPAVRAGRPWGSTGAADVS